MRTRWLVVGAGLSGATLAERIARGLDDPVHVVDRRDHIAGNAFDGTNEHGVMVHHYGAHIFHTGSSTVWRYLSRFTDWREYRHRVLAEVQGAQVPLPFSFDSIDCLFSPTEAELIKHELLGAYPQGTKVPILKLMESDRPRLRSLAELIYRYVFLGYTTKQWGCRPEDLDRAVSGRVPVIVGPRTEYFDDTYQGIPSEGYTAMVARMLDHPNITVSTATSFDQARGTIDFDRLVFTGPLDELLGYRYGALAYRSLSFCHRTRPGSGLQPVAVINFPNDHLYTRTLEHRHLTGQIADVSTITEEHPQDHEPGKTEPYYPVLTAGTRALHKRYLDAVATEMPGAYFAGRLADYRYYDMDQAVLRALLLYREIAGDQGAAQAAAPLASVTE
jgi:UDP-galactopyranose mutase